MKKITPDMAEYMALIAGLCADSTVGAVKEPQTDEEKDAYAAGFAIAAAGAMLGTYTHADDIKKLDDPPAVCHFIAKAVITSATIAMKMMVKVYNLPLSRPIADEVLGSKIVEGKATLAFSPMAPPTEGRRTPEEMENVFADIIHQAVTFNCMTQGVNPCVDGCHDKDCGDRANRLAVVRALAKVAAGMYLTVEKDDETNETLHTRCFEQVMSTLKRCKDGWKERN